MFPLSPTWVNHPDTTDYRTVSSKYCSELHYWRFCFDYCTQCSDSTTKKVMPRTTEITKLSSHIVGSDHVGRKIDMNPGSPVEGIYGSSGFYFQVGS